MKEFIAICGAVLLGLVLVGLLNGTAGNTAGSLAGSAKSVVSQANTSITDIFP